MSDGRYPALVSKRSAQPNAAARRKGKKVVLSAYFAFVVAVIAVCTTEISLQAWAGAKRVDADPVDCAPGILSLKDAVERAIARASEDTGTERQAVESFRKNLEPEWLRRDAIRAACVQRPAMIETLDAVLHWGWAEERSVRQDALGTTEFRRQARQLIARNISPAVSSTPLQPPRP